MHQLKIALVASLLLFFQGSALHAQQNLPPGFVQKTNQELASLRSEIQQLKSSRNTAAAAGLVSFLFGAFCALWAQNSNRSAWLWFFFGLIFSGLAVVVLLIKNSNDRRRRTRGNN